MFVTYITTYAMLWRRFLKTQTINAARHVCYVYNKPLVHFQGILNPPGVTPEVPHHRTAKGKGKAREASGGEQEEDDSAEDQNDDWETGPSDSDDEFGNKSRPAVVKESRMSTLGGLIGLQVNGEAHKIKNLATYTAHAIYFIKATQQVFVSATPTFNTLSYLASIMEQIAATAGRRGIHITSTAEEE